MTPARTGSAHDVNELAELLGDDPRAYGECEHPCRTTARTEG